VSNAAHKQQFSANQRKRNEVEGYFGSGKRQYSLDLIMARLPRGAEALISMAFIVMCAENIRRIIRLFLITIFAWLFAWERTDCLWAGLRQFWQLETTELLVVD
jgi:IS5 family transposase